MVKKLKKLNLGPSDIDDIYRLFPDSNISTRLVKPDSTARIVKPDNSLEDALTAAERETRLFPNTPDAWTNKSIALAELGNHAEALTAYDKAIELNPKDAEAWTNKGIALAELGRYIKAKAAREKARSLLNK